MAYDLQSVVAKAGVFPQPISVHFKVISLGRGIEMVPLAGHARQLLGLGPNVAPLAYRCVMDQSRRKVLSLEPVELPPALLNLCTQFSQRGVVAYIEANYLGGWGTQAHVIFDGGAVYGPAVASHDAINQALRILGVDKAGFGADEFDAVGLGRCRFTERWLE